jgi:hypothetical protein
MPRYAPSRTSAFERSASIAPIDPAVSVLVTSCDRYRDLWPPFFTLFFRYWPDCPYSVYLGANEQTYADPRVEAVLVGPDRDWARGVRTMLDRMPTRWVVVLLEDYLLNRPADGGRIASLATVARERDAACLRLAPIPGASSELPDLAGVGELPPGTPYRVSLQAAVWDRNVLSGLVREGESPWRLEIDGSRRSDALDRPFLSVTQASTSPLPYFATGVVRGRWLREAVELCRAEGIEPDLNARPLESSWQRLRRTRTPERAARVMAIAARIRNSS